jgi:hypothetical protein
MNIVNLIGIAAFLITIISMIVQYFLRKKLLKEFEIDTFKGRMNSKTITSLLASKNLTKNSSANRIIKQVRLLGVLKGTFMLAWFYILLVILRIAPSHL